MKNEIIKQEILNILANADAPLTANEIAERLDDVSTQKTCAILLSLRGNNNVVRICQNHRSYYAKEMPNEMPNAVNIEWILERDYFQTLSIKEKINWIISDFLLDILN